MTNFQVKNRLRCAVRMLAVFLASAAVLSWSAPPDRGYRALVSENAARGYAGAQFNLARYFEDESRFEEAIQWYRKAAEQDHPDAEYALFRVYQDGRRDVNVDLDQARDWLARAALHGQADAQDELARRYEITGDYSKAVYWYERAAEQGVRKAQATLGSLYAEGRGPLRDDVRAAYWLERAAEQGDSDAEHAIGNMYVEGRGVERSYARALKWLRRASDQGVVEADYAIGTMYEKGLGTPVDVAMALQHYERAAQYGATAHWLAAKLALGRLYLDGNGIPKDNAKAHRWLADAADAGSDGALALLRELAEGGYIPAHRSLAHIYDKRQDVAEAARWYQAPAEANDDHAQYRLAEAYRLGQGIPRDLARAATWYRAASERGNADAQYQLADAYLFGNGVGRDPREAVKWYRESAENGNAAAQLALGEIFSKGSYFEEYGIHQDGVEALRWYRRAAAQGVPLAAQQLTLLGEVASVAVLMPPAKPAAMAAPAAPVPFERLEPIPSVVHKVKKSSPRKREGPWAPLKYRVWYGTNRKPVDLKDSSKGFGAEQDQVLHFGYVDVFVPESHDPGSVGSLTSSLRKSVRNLKWTDDRLRVIARLELKPDGFAQQVAQSLGYWPKDERIVVVYIHGFNVTFDEAAIRAGQIGVDLKIPGVVAFYSWPSVGSESPRDFNADQQAALACSDYLADFLVRIADLAKSVKASRIEVVAHSMGNFALLHTLNDTQAWAKLQKGGVRFEQIFLAAPAIGIEEFKRLAKVHAQIAGKTTMYISPLDKAVGAGDFWEKTKLVGRSPPVTTVDGIDTVEVKDIDLDFLGHGYLFEAREVLKDWGSVPEVSPHIGVAKQQPGDER